MRIKFWQRKPRERGSIVIRGSQRTVRLTERERVAAQASVRRAMSTADDDEDRFYRSHKDGTCGCLEGGY